MDDVFKALADSTRRRLLDSLNANGGQSLTELCAGVEMARQSVSKHLAILEKANLVTTVRSGRVKLHYLNAAPIAEISDRWINQYHRRRVEALSDLKKALEVSIMQKPEFVYTTYINSTPEQVWKALTDASFTERYWGVSFDTDWSAGSTLTVILTGKGVRIEDPEQRVLESDPFHRLSYTWHTFTDEWASAYDIGPETLAAYRSEGRSKVSFDIEEFRSMVKLTVIHDGFEEGSKILEGVTQGWPAILASMKTLLETGEALPTR
jgi:uncharacterized protein YndB with AHSA1/START domain/DNA-binding transcriptional ArsR family regulator